MKTKTPLHRTAHVVHGHDADRAVRRQAHDLIAFQQDLGEHQAGVHAIGFAGMDAIGDPQDVLAGGADAQVLAWSNGVAAWTSAPFVNRLLLSGAVFLDGFVPTLPDNAPSIGRFYKGGSLFLHSGGVANTALGSQALNPIGQLDGGGTERQKCR
jgi:hypothetical protein